MTDPHPPPLRALHEDGDADILAQTSVKEDTLSRRGTFVARDNKLAISVQTPLLRFRQCVSCRPQVISFCGRVGRIQLRGLAKGGGRWRRRTSRASVARGERAGCAEQRTGEATYARGRKCENALELRGRAPAEFPDQAFARESTLDTETALWARWGAHRARVEADA